MADGFAQPLQRLLGLQPAVHPVDGPAAPSPAAAAAAESLQLCPTLCDPRDHGPPGSSVHGILQARILGWVAISFSIIGV